jgi:glutamyl-Q tRNA(Asp) synthetase
MQSPPVRGRFAPSPTGPLHFGSLVAALGSYADARNCGGEWLLRMEDLDPPREIPGAADDILRALEAFGFEWDGAATYQSERVELYQDALARLAAAGTTYACACSRREIADSSVTGTDGSQVYPGTCSRGLAPGRTPRATRVRVDAQVVEVDDAVQGCVRQTLERDVGDFVLRRADGCFAYQLAVVVDDAAQGITAVVRGADLLDSTPRQIFLQRLLGFPTPAYLHLPIATNAGGEKLSKQTLATALDRAQAGATLTRALRFLGQHTPEDLARESAREVLSFAIAHWNRDRIPRRRAIPVPG